MNAKQAKKLRAQARQSGEAIETTYTMKVFPKVYADVLTGNVKQYRVYTASMTTCVRSVYQSLKKEFKRKA